MESKKDKKLLVFLCQKATNPANAKATYRIASALAKMGIAELGNLSRLSAQHNSSNESRSKMLFLNECRAGCVRVLTHGFNEDDYIFVDIYESLSKPTFSIEGYIDSEVLPKIKEKWGCDIHCLLSKSMSRTNDH